MDDNRALTCLRIVCQHMALIAKNLCVQDVKCNPFVAFILFYFIFSLYFTHTGLESDSEPVLHLHIELVRRRGLVRMPQVRQPTEHAQ